MRGDPDAPRPLWAVPEAAWFLALVGGLVATWAGALSGVPGLGAMLAGAFATVYQAVLLRRRLFGAAGMAAAAAILGVLVGAVGLVLEVGWSGARGYVPFAELYVDAAIAPLYDGGEGAGAAAPAQAGIAAALALLALALARPTRGLVPALLAALFAGVLGIAAPHAAAGGEPSATTVLQCLHSVPPWALAQLVGVVLLASVLASDEPVRPLAELPRDRRRLLWIGAPALALGLALQPALAGPWGAWVPAG